MSSNHNDYSDDECYKQEEYDCYGKTPPRTRQLRKYKERKCRDKENLCAMVKNSPKMAKRFLKRRNTITNMFDELILKADTIEAENGSKRNDKRSLKLLRGSERDLKLDIASAQHAAHHDVEAEAVNTPQPRRIASCKRFMSLCSRRVTTLALNNRPLYQRKNSAESPKGTGDFDECPPSRVDFHKTLSKLIKMGCGDKTTQERTTRRHLSKEEVMWQTEVKDLIWLELQAWHADRTMSEQDTYLCEARESVAPLLDTIMNYKFVTKCKCTNCISMYCECCMEAQNTALKEVEALLGQLEATEALFPSSRAFAELFPIYQSAEFVGRVKAMCLWYNMTKHQRLKLVILGKLLICLDSWNVIGNSMDSSPSESNSSADSMHFDHLDIYNVSVISNLIENKMPYRRYIENILKTRGLSKSMSFLERLHQHVLYKAQITLEKPSSDDVFKEQANDQVAELIRYGCWSPEAQALSLPSYKASFLFLSAVPLEVTHEFLRMRLEQKPVNPSPLSVRQLMRELKEGIKIAVTQRDRIVLNIFTVIENERCDDYKRSIDAFDDSLLALFKDYLDYVGIWAMLQHDCFQKSLLEDEWFFVCDVMKRIPNVGNYAAVKFVSILGEMLSGIGTRLMSRINEIAVEINTKEEDHNRKQNLFVLYRELQALFTEERELSIKIISFAKTILKSGISIKMEDFKSYVLTLKCTIPKAIETVQNLCDQPTLDHFDEIERASFISRCREILMQGYRFGFEFYKEMSEFVPTESKQLLTKSMVQFAHLWMKFALERCERGRGKRPRWAFQGLDFLLTVCEPQYTRFLTDDEFEELKLNMDRCISHVIGTTAPSTPDSGFHSASPRPTLDLNRFPRSRGSSPCTRPTYKSQRSATRRYSERTVPDTIDSPTNCVNKIIITPALRSERVKDAVYSLDVALDGKLQEECLIGRVISKEPTNKHIRRRNVQFSWQRGIKIGQGRFGKVYTAVNNDTGEMMAVKEVALQPNDVNTVRKVSEEIKIMEGIIHKHLVRYYGLEIHKEEMLIFMEFCPEGTLESLVAATESGLPELLIRRYTFQLVSGVCALHEHGIVHRDIKTANIFLSEEGNCLKIGDFGCAVKIKSHVTMPGELQGFVGTQAYMAPEMFMKTSVDGHGRAADIWSVGCCVVEMASGKRPWAEFDSNYQIMFKVGMGERPHVPDSLIDEGHDFLDRCFQHDPKKRATSLELLSHNFVQIGEDFSP